MQKNFITITLAVLFSTLSACGQQSIDYEAVRNQELARSLNAPQTSQSFELPLITTPDYLQEFSGKTPSVIGPLGMPKGLYKLTVNTANYMIVQEMTGDSSSLFNLSSGEAVDAETTFYAPADGNYIFKIWNTRGNWTLKIEDLDLSNPVPISELNNVPVAYAQKVLGPYSVTPKAYYKFYAYVNSYFIMSPVSVYDDSYQFSIFNLSSGNYGATTLATFSSRIVLFKTWNVSGAWAVRVEQF